MSKNKTDNPRQVAIWVDHHEAYFASFTNKQLTKDVDINSDADPHTHGGGWAQHRIDAHRYEQLKHFYDAIVEQLGNVDEILIMGPGQAKHELRSRIEHHKGLRGKVVAMETTDKIAESQFLVKAEDFFS